MAEHPQTRPGIFAPVGPCLSLPWLHCFVAA